jgi:hypothetical protein
MFPGNRMLCSVESAVESVTEPVVESAIDGK